LGGLTHLSRVFERTVKILSERRPGITIQENLFLNGPTIQENLFSNGPTIQENLFSNGPTIQANLFSNGPSIQKCYSHTGMHKGIWAYFGKSNQNPDLGILKFPKWAL